MGDQDNNTVDHDAHDQRTQEMGDSTTQESRDTVTQKKSFNFKGFDVDLIDLRLEGPSYEMLLQKHQLTEGLDMYDLVYTNLLAIARTALLFRSEVATPIFYKIVCLHCGIKFDEEKRPETVENIIYSFCFARKHYSHRGSEVHRNVSTLATMFDELIWLIDNSAQLKPLSYTDYILLATAWGELLDRGLAQFMDQNLDNRALVQTCKLCTPPPKMTTTY
jgi:hypothetical protein